MTGLTIARGCCNAIVATADLVGSWTLVAVMVTEVPVAGAVKAPVEEIVPAEADQVTALEMAPVPVTTSVQVVVAAGARVLAPQDTVTELTEGAACVVIVIVLVTDCPLM